MPNDSILHSDGVPGSARTNDTPLSSEGCGWEALTAIVNWAEHMVASKIKFASPQIALVPCSGRAIGSLQAERIQPASLQPASAPNSFCEGLGPDESEKSAQYARDLAHMSGYHAKIVVSCAAAEHQPESSGIVHAAALRAATGTAIVAGATSRTDRVHYAARMAALEEVRRLSRAPSF